MRVTVGNVGRGFLLLAQIPPFKSCDCSSSSSEYCMVVKLLVLKISSLISWGGGGGVDMPYVFSSLIYNLSERVAFLPVY